MSTEPPTHQVAAAVIRRGDELLLVQQQGPHDPFPTWSLPGGVTKPGEMLSETLTRELLEETGLLILETGQLLYFVQLDDQEAGIHSLAFVFEVDRWEGELQPADPDGFILDAGFYPQTEAIRKLEQLPWRAMREPLLAYLRGEASPGAAWFYRRSPGEAEALEALSPSR